MESKMVIFVGSLSNKYIEAFKKEGYSIGFFRDANDANIEKFLPNYLHKLSFISSVNFETKESIATSLKNLYFNPNTLLVCIFEKHFYPTALIAEYLKLDQSNFLDTQKSQHLTNKFYQRKEISKISPEITPAFKKIRTFHGSYLFSRKYGFPVVVKPANLVKGELVNICNNIEELSRKVSFVLDHVTEVYKRDKVYSKPEVIVEQFIDGRQFSVDSYVDKNGGVTHTPVCKQVISHDLGYDDFQTYYSQYPSELNETEENMVLETVKKAIQALKITSSTTHTEVKLDSKNHCKVIEVNVRPGGFRDEMLLESYNIQHSKNFISTLLGDTVDVKTKLQKYSACPQFWADKEGEFVSVENQEKIEQLESFAKFKVVVKKGDEIGPVNKGFGRVAYAILAHENKKILEHDLKEIRNLVTINMS